MLGSLSVLPAELLLKILRCLLLDPSSLLRCALVCRSLCPYAREVLFRETRLVEWTTSADRTRQFAQLLESNHDLGSCIHSLCIHMDYSRSHKVPSSPLTPQFQMFFEHMRIMYIRDVSPDPEWYPDVVGVLPLARFSELRELVVEEGVAIWDPVEQVVALLEALPRLERLSLQGVMVGTNGGAWESNAGTVATTTAAQFPAQSSLKTLEIDHVPRFPFCKLVQQLLRSRGSIGLASLSARCRTWRDLFEHHDGWIPLIAAMNGSLRHLTISTGEHNHEEPPESHDNVVDDYSLHGALFNAVQGCRLLRTLHLDYLLPRTIGLTVASHRADFLRCLCHMLETHPPFSDHLEQLSLRMIEWCDIMVSVDRGLCNRLARVLLDSTRYPRFKSFHVRVRVEDTMFSDDEMPPLERDEDCAVEARWRECFADFGKPSTGVCFLLEVEGVQ